MIRVEVLTETYEFKVPIQTIPEKMSEQGNIWCVMMTQNIQTAKLRF